MTTSTRDLHSVMVGCIYIYIYKVRVALLLQIVLLRARMPSAPHLALLVAQALQPRMERVAWRMPRHWRMGLHDWYRMTQMVEMAYAARCGGTRLVPPIATIPPQQPSGSTGNDGIETGPLESEPSLRDDEQGRIEAGQGSCCPSIYITPLGNMQQQQ